MRRVVLGSAVILSAAAAFGAPIPYIGVQFVAPGGGPFSGPATTALNSGQSAGYYPQSNYNTLTLAADATGGSFTDVALNNAAGLPTNGVTLSSMYNDVWGTSTDGSMPNGALLQGELKSGGGATSTITLNNVPAGVYSLVAYIENDDSSNVNADYTVGSQTFYVADQGVGGSPDFAQASNPNPAGPRDTGNFVEFDNIVLASAGPITLSFTGISGGNSDAAVNGLQLLSVPEPASLSALGFASLGLLRRRRA